MSGGRPWQECVLSCPQLEYAHQLCMLALLLWVPVNKCFGKLQTTASSFMQKGLSIVLEAWLKTMIAASGLKASVHGTSVLPVHTLPL